jgi:AGZA family xanthine/uracil permease-like MFS transporter
MGGRAAYTLATALFIGVAAYFGWFAHLFDWLPKAAMFPILIYVGLEITAQSFKATPARHYPALALAALPALAYLITIPLNMVRRPSLDGDTALIVQTLTSLANGFIVTSLLWGAALAALIDGGYRRAAAYLAFAGVLALFGVIHSPLQSTVIDLPGRVVSRLASGEDTAAQRAALLHTPYHWACTYALIAVFFLILSRFGEGKGSEASQPADAPLPDAKGVPPDDEEPTERVFFGEVPDPGKRQK